MIKQTVQNVYIYKDFGASPGGYTFSYPLKLINNAKSFIVKDITHVPNGTPIAADDLASHLYCPELGNIILGNICNNKYYPLGNSLYFDDKLYSSGELNFFVRSGANANVNISGELIIELQFNLV